MKEIIGTARIVETGFDVDRMERWFDMRFDPPWDGIVTKRVYFCGMDSDALPIPMQDEQERAFQRRYARRLGYELVE